jgi:HEPN domain-containing protein
MPPDDLHAEITAQWISKADEDLSLSEHLLKTDTPYRSAIAFHSQQAAEKYLKAMLTYYRTAFPKTHDLAGLLDMLLVLNKDAANALEDIVELTPFAVESRYPGDFPVVMQSDASRTVELARLAGSVAHSVIQYRK